MNTVISQHLLLHKLNQTNRHTQQRVLDTLIRDGADVHRQNKFKNTPHDVANSAECRGILRRAEALPAPSAEEGQKMHDENLQVVLLLLL